MSTEQKLEMSLDDIIKTNKKGSGKAGAKGKVVAKGKSPKAKAGVLRKTKTTPRGGKGASPAQKGVIARRALQLRQSKAKKAIGGARKQASAASTSKLVSQLVKKALMQSGRLTQARKTRTPLSMRAAAKRTPVVTAARRGRGGRQAVGQQRKPVVSGQLRSRLGWTATQKGARGRGAVSRGRGGTRGRGVAKGRGVVGAAHMDAEAGQRRSRAQTQRRVQQQQVQQRVTQQRQQVQQRVNQQRQQRQTPLQQPRFAGRIGRGRGRGAVAAVGRQNDAQFIRNTVFKAMAEAAMGRAAPVARGMARVRRGGGAIQTRNARQQQQMMMGGGGGGMRGFTDRPFIQSAPRRQRQAASNFFSGQSFDNPQRAVFSQSSGATTLNQRFGGGEQRSMFF